MPFVSQSNFLQAMGWAILNSFWQMALLWVIFKVILSFSPKMSAAKKAGLATGFLITGFGWFVYTFISLFVSSSTSNPLSTFAVKIVDEQTWTEWAESILPIASVIYFVLLLIPLWQFARNYRYVLYIRNNGLSKADLDWRMFVKRMAARMGIKKEVNIWLSELVNSPVTIGYLKPVILIPVAAINNLSTEQAEAIILHELSHIRRLDYLFNLIIHFIKTVLYFNPFVKLFAGVVEKERETSCDEMVMQFQYKPYDYASALLLLEKKNEAKHEMMMAAAGKQHDLLHRVENILGIKRNEIFSFRRFSAVIAVLIGAFIINAFLFISKHPEGKIIFGINNPYNPYYLLAGNREQPLEEVQVNPVNTEYKPAPAPASIASKMDKENTLAEEESPADPDVTEAVNPGFFNVNFTTPVAPELDQEEEAQLKETVEATKKVIQESQWKKIETTYAEVLNSKQKNKLKDEYSQELSKVDWNKLEDKLRQSYNYLDWEKVNTQLQASLAQIKIDSIQTAVTIALSDLTKLETWMKENKVTCIPDSDVTLHSVKQEQQKAKEQLNRVRAVKEKKVIKL